MMTSQILERASEAFRKGYRDARRDTNVGIPDDLPRETTFYGFDYREGFSAARNEQWHVARRGL